MPLSKIIILSFVAIVTMVNPLAVIPSFVALTGGISRRTRASVAFVAGIACIIVLTVFLLAGNYVFKFFGITVPAFQIMGGVIFLTNAMRTLVDDERRAFDVGGEKRMADSDKEKAEIDPSSIAIVPIAVPLIADGGINAGLFVAALGVSSTIVDVSPFSTNGALMLANRPDTISEPVYYKQILSYSVLIVLVGPLLVWAALVLPGW